MKSQGFAVFVVFFGISLLDALWTGHWVRAMFWVGIGIAFFALDQFRKGRRVKTTGAV